MKRLRLITAATLAAGLVAGAEAAEVEIEYVITGQGTGPGTCMEVLTTQHEVKVLGECGICAAWSPQYPNCVKGEGAYGVTLLDIAPVPEGQSNVFASFSGGDSYWADGRFFWRYHDCYQCPVSAGYTGCGSSPDCVFSARLPESPLDFAVGVTYITGSCSIFACGCPGCKGGPGCCGCNLGGCCGGQADSWQMTVQYLKKSPTAPFQCTKTGTGSIEADGNWYYAADARQNTCIGGQCKGQPLPQCCPCVAPNNDTVYSALIPSQTPTGYEVKAVMASVTAYSGDEYSGPNGPYLLVKAEPGCQGCNRPLSRIPQCPESGESWGPKHLDCLEQHADILPDWCQEKLGWGIVKVLWLVAKNKMGAVTCPTDRTFCNAGCFVTCIAMVSGTKTPPEVNVIATCNGDVDKDGDIKELSSDSEKMIGVKWSGPAYENPTPDDIMNACKIGYPIAKLWSPTTGKYHFVVVTESLYAKEKGCRFRIADPGKNNYQYLDEYEKAGRKLILVSVYKRGWSD